jgi:hypothetical protein
MALPEELPSGLPDIEFSVFEEHSDTGEGPLYHIAADGQRLVTAEVESRTSPDLWVSWAEYDEGVVTEMALGGCMLALANHLSLRFPERIRFIDGEGKVFPLSQSSPASV